jgi:hypothetical protein
MLVPIPRKAVPLLDPALRPGYVAALLALILGGLTLTGTLVNQDEIYYAGQARLLAQGRLTPRPGDPLPVEAAHPVRSFRYPIGWPLLLAPLAPLGIRAMHVATLALHLLGGIAFARMLARRGVWTGLNALYLFHPVFWLYAQSLLTDVPAGAVLLLAMDAWEQGRPAATGLGIGYAFLMRVAAAVTAVGAALALLPELFRKGGRRRDALVAGGVAAAVGMLVLIVNYLVTGNPVRSSYGPTHWSMFGVRVLGSHLLLYLGGLLLLPPFTLLFALARPRKVDAWAWVALPVLLFFLLYRYHDLSPRWYETLVGGQRLVIAAHVALLAATARAWGGWVRPRLGVAGLAVMAVAAVAVSAAWHRLEARYVPARDALAACGAENWNAGRVALSVEADRYYLIGHGNEIAPADAYVLAERRPTNRPDDPDVRSEVPPELPAGAAGCARVGEFLILDMSGGCGFPRDECPSSRPGEAPASQEEGPP